MAANSKIEWTDHTFNPWRGCTKVAAGCVNCYAETLSKRNPGTLGIWGSNGSRVVASESQWRQPLKWNEAAELAVEAVRLALKRAPHKHPGLTLPARPRVFCASLADVFEDWSGKIDNSRGEQLWYQGERWTSVPGGRTLDLNHVRRRLFALIDATPHLDWLLLTKRPENIARMWCSHVNTDGSPPSSLHRLNVWLGSSIATQEDADRNIPELLKCRDLASVLFVSAEPLLGPVDLTRLVMKPASPEERQRGKPDVSINALHGWYGTPSDDRAKLDWLICGGESGHGARPMHPQWARSLRDQCTAAGVPFHFKQWGEWCGSQVNISTGEDTGTAKMFRDYEHWVGKARTWVNGGMCLDMLGRELTRGEHFAAARDQGGFPVAVMHRTGKKQAGRVLDGRTWDELPTIEGVRA
jgi:protein gp37